MIVYQLSRILPQQTQQTFPVVYAVLTDGAYSFYVIPAAPANNASFWIVRGSNFMERRKC